MGNDVFKPGKQFATHTVTALPTSFAVQLCLRLPFVKSFQFRKCTPFTFFSSNARANQIKPQKVATKT